MSSSKKLKSFLTSKNLDPKEVKLHNDNKLKPKNDYILYWMQQSQRIKDNKALVVSALLAQNLNLPLVIGFVFIPEFPEGNHRHFSFMYDGIEQIKKQLEDTAIDLKIKIGDPVDKVKTMAAKSACVITDSGYLKPAQNWRKNLGKKLQVPLLEVSSNLIVPIEIASHKEEYAAYTLRKKLKPEIEDHLKIWQLPDDLPAAPNFSELPELFADKKKFLNDLNLTNNTPKIRDFPGGYQAAKNILNDFIANKLPQYEDKRSDPDYECESDLSPYLHFGHISPREVAIKTRKAAKERNLPLANFWDELIIRRELSFNFVYYNRQYDKFPEFLPDWARETLNIHREDKREYVYGRHQFESASTHDKYWNAAQLELIHRGKIHNYMRMYWGKKILEWSNSPKKAFDICLYLNNKYALDGRDPNSYGGVAWCFGKHDRAWQERKIYGKVRYMNRNGLERKFKLNDYIDKVKNLAGIKELPGE